MVSNIHRQSFLRRFPPAPYTNNLKVRRPTSMKRERKRERKREKREKKERDKEGERERESNGGIRNGHLALANRRETPTAGEGYKLIGAW